MKKKAKSTYKEFIENNEQKFLLDKEYKELLLSELLIAVMKQDHISVRKLAVAAGVSATVIQGVRSGAKTNITIDTLSRILDAVGYQIIFAPKNGPVKQLKSA
ncbi:MAG: helix-turn-helix domain-containing protein [Parachlamydiaceae bacterium]